MVNDAGLTALLDSGSMHNFIDTKSARRAGIHLRDDLDLHVAVANRDCLSCASRCPDLAILIGAEPFTINCYDLSLGSYEMVLGV
jgi:hypothetical protein